MEKKEKIEEIEILDFEEETPAKDQTIVNSSSKEIPTKDPLIANDSPKETTENNKAKNKVRPIIIAVLVFVIIGLSIVYMPTILDYIKVNFFKATTTDNQNGNEYKSGINVSDELNSIKENKNYVYEEVIETKTKDEKNNTVNVETNILYSFNDGKIKVDYSKYINEYSLTLTDYYEKIDSSYNKYIYDITEKSNHKLATTEEEYNSIYNIYPTIIGSLISNNQIKNESKVKTIDGEDEILIKVSSTKEIFNILSFETDRINSKIDTTKIIEPNVLINLVFDNNKKIKRIEFELVTTDAYKDNGSTESNETTIKFTFKNFSSVENITLPQ